MFNYARGIFQTVVPPAVLCVWSVDREMSTNIVYPYICTVGITLIPTYIRYSITFLVVLQFCTGLFFLAIRTYCISSLVEFIAHGKAWNSHK
jgi:hypothetical protein